MRCITQAFFGSPVLFALVPLYASISRDIKTHANLETWREDQTHLQHATLKTQSDLSNNTWNKMQPSKKQKKVLHQAPKMSPEKIKTIFSSLVLHRNTVEGN